jgi:hypothetical protein
MTSGGAAAAAAGLKGVLARCMCNRTRGTKTVTSRLVYKLLFCLDAEWNNIAAVLITLTQLRVC